MESRSPAGNPTSDPSAQAATAQGRRWWARVLIILVLVAFFAPAYMRHAWLSASGWMNDDARQQIWPLLRFYDDLLLPNDLVADYYLACLPAGFTGLYRLLSPFDPRAVSKVLPYVLLAVTAVSAWRAARRLRGPAAGWATLALVLGAQVYLARSAGGLPRSFAFPVLALMLFAVARGKPMRGALATLLGALFYPAAGVVCGLTLAAWLLLPAKLRGNAETWGLGRRTGLLLATAVASIGVLVPTYSSSQSWGPVLRPSDAVEYPELSAEGRYTYEDRTDHPFSLQAAKNFVEAPLAGLGGEWDPSRSGLRMNLRAVAALALLAAGATGFGLLARTSAPARRVLLLPLAAVVGYVLSALAAPLLYIPSRYQLYPLAVSAVVIVPAGLAHLATLVVRSGDQRRTQSLVLLATAGLYLLFFSAYRLSFGENAGVSLSPLSTAGIEPPRRDHAEVMAFIRELPATTVIAGWPGDLDGVPYQTARTALVTRETHQAFHRKYTDLMRARAKAVIAALYDTDPNAAAVRRLSQDFGVTHLVVNTRMYDGSGVPRYFAPFDADLAAAREAVGRKTPIVRSAGFQALTQVFPIGDSGVEGERPDWVILDLTKLPPLARRSAASQPMPAEAPSGP
jgi:hypothetical protein